MNYAIELLFDKKTEKQISAFFLKMKKRKISSAMASTGSRPHISLFGFKTDDRVAVSRALKIFATKTKTFSLNFGKAHIGVFSNTGVVFLAPTVTLELLQAHRKCEKIVGKYMKEVWDNYRINHLFFHCTLGLRMSRRQILRAIKLAMESKLPSVVKVVEVGLVAVPEEPIPRVKEIFTTKLANRTFKNS